MKTHSNEDHHGGDYGGYGGGNTPSHKAAHYLKKMTMNQNQGPYNNKPYSGGPSTENIQSNSNLAGGKQGNN